MSAPRVFALPSGIQLSEAAYLVGLRPLFAAHELEQQRLEQAKKDRRRQQRRDRQAAMQRGLL